MKKLRVIVGACVALAVMAGVTLADAIYNEMYNTAPVIRIYNGFSTPIETRCTSTYDTNLNVVVVITKDSGTTAFTNTISNGVGTNDTVALLAASLASVTNSAGKKLLTIDAGCSVGSTIITNKLQAGVTNTIQPGAWGEIGAHDTSAALFYSVYKPPRKCGGPAGAFRVKRIFGDCAGTGTLTVRGYIDGTQVYQQTITSPVYVWDSMTTNIFASSADNSLGCQLDIDWPVTVGEGSSLLITATRATTATTGNLGVILDDVNEK